MTVILITVMAVDRSGAPQGCLSQGAMAGDGPAAAIATGRFAVQVPGGPVEALDAVGLALRVVLGIIMIAHGYNHWRGPGGLAGTARWFDGLGLQPARLHALASVLVEFGAGGALVIGLLTPVAAGAIVGTMVVAGLAAHRGNGFFVFKEGYEYVLLIAVVCLCLAATGPGRVSLDHALGVNLNGGIGAAIAAVVGLGGGLGLLAASWRPSRERTGA